MFKEKVEKLKVWLGIKVKGKKTFLKILEERGLQNNDEDIFKLYKSVFQKTENEGLVSLKNLGKVYNNGYKAIHNFNLDIHKGEFVSLLGPSGCGKTTILRMIAGLELISEGDLSINNINMNGALPKERGIAMVFQNYALYPYMNIYENIAFGLKNLTFSNETSEKILIESISLANKNLVEIKDIKYKIFKLKQKYKPQIKSLRFKIKSSSQISNNNSNQLLNDKKELKFLKKTRQSFLKSEAKPEIKKLNSYLKNIKNEKTPKFQKKEQKKEWVKNIQNYKESIVIWKYSIPARVNYFSNMVGISDYLNRRPHSLSGGQRQRVSLVRAISKDVGLFLFDEPLSNLDAKLRNSMRSEIRKLHDNLGSSSVFVTHDQYEAMSISDKIVLMNKGYIQQVGTPNDLFNEPANVFVADFIGSPSINFIEAKYVGGFCFKIKNKIIKMSTLSSTVEEKLNEFLNKKLIIGLRPQNIITDETLMHDNDPNVFVTKVINVESVGHENIVNVKSLELGENFKVVAGRYFLPKKGEKIKILIDRNSVHVFDPVKGFSLSWPPNKETSKAMKIWEESSKERVYNNIVLEKEKTKLKKHQKIVAIIRAKSTNKKNKTNFKDESLVRQVSGNEN